MVKVWRIDRGLLQGIEGFAFPRPSRVVYSAGRAHAGVSESSALLHGRQ